MAVSLQQQAACWHPFGKLEGLLKTVKLRPVFAKFFPSSFSRRRVAREGSSSSFEIEFCFLANQQALETCNRPRKPKNRLFCLHQSGYFLEGFLFNNWGFIMVF